MAKEKTSDDSVAASAPAPEVVPPKFEGGADGGPPPPQYEGPRYIDVSSSQDATYLLRSDGIVDRTTGGGKVSKQMIPEEPHRYIAVESGHYASYLLRSDGTIFRSPGSGKIKGEIRPPAGGKYIALSAGEHASYFVRDDGKVDRSTGKAKVDSEIVPEGWPEVKYVSVSAGDNATFFVRDDGFVDRMTGSTKPEQTMKPSKPGVKYIRVGDQLSVTRSTGQATWVEGTYAAYLVRDDGVVDRTVKDGKITEELKPDSPDVTYIDASSGLSSSYLIRSDGQVDQLKGTDQVSKKTFDGTDREKKAHDPALGDRPPRYVGVTCGDGSKYFLRADGLVDRSTGKGKISHAMRPQTREEFAATHNGSSCIVA